MSTIGSATLRVLRAAYGWLLRVLPGGTADQLRGVVARARLRFPGLHAGAGDRIPVPGNPDDPVVLLVATGAPVARLTALRDHLVDAPARLVWLIDADEPAVLADQVIEWMPPADGLGRAGLDSDAIRASRLAVVEARYRPRRVVVLAATGPLPDLVLVSGPPR